MKAHSKLSTSLCENLEFPSISRGRGSSRRPTLPKLRHGSSILNNSGSLNTTECSYHKKEDSFSISGKPPRVPVLRTGQLKPKERNDNLLIENIDYEKYYIAEYQKHEIVNSRQIYNSQMPFWFIDSMGKSDNFNHKTKESTRSIGLSIEDIELANTNRSNYLTWLRHMQMKSED
ncbi:hypothetical protein SteCoe_4121 [Stentor coeruleus]|uniref:Uncharacterized protein n=1 Tax=Stentor coeruleus TaxID=5963 RepID=A0A1R2CVK3_9CILI|nr:hypothetical protein SteCoe_4121 [Stentor coeruleus]